VTQKKLEITNNRFHAILFISISLRFKRRTVCEAGHELGVTPPAVCIVSGRTPTSKRIPIFCPWPVTGLMESNCLDYWGVSRLSFRQPDGGNPIWRFISQHGFELMKSRFIYLSCVLSLICLLSACKKADPVEAPGDSAESAPSAETAAASSAPAKTPADSATGVLLEMKWPVGNRYVYRMDLEQHSTNHISANAQADAAVRCVGDDLCAVRVEETERGERELEMEFLGNEMEITMGEQVIVNFDSKEKGEETACKACLRPRIEKWSAQRRACC